MSAPTIIKADGSSEPFVSEKLAHSLKRSGASAGDAAEITAVIETELKDGATTQDIYRRAHALLAKRGTAPAGRYGLRRALFDLGPTGFPFEDFLAELLRAEGYAVEVGVEAKGTCAPHEVDLVAHRGEECFIAEAKFHARHGLRSDLQVALYSYARLLDLKGRTIGTAPCPVRSGYLITNTKFTKVAIDYATCVGLELVSWGYPDGASLRERIEAAGLYPVTTLPSVSERDKRLMLEHGLVLCRDMADRRKELEALGLSQEKTDTIIAESVNLCSA